MASKSKYTQELLNCGGMTEVVPPFIGGDTDGFTEV